jgi:hypothetical protein
VTTALWILASTALFLTIHLAFHVPGRFSFPVALKLSRGVAALLLVATGAAALAAHFPRWPELFLTPPGEDPLLAAVCLVFGHLLADFLWLGYGAFVLRKRQRVDLVLHHAFGVLACLAALYLDMAYTLIGVILLSEALPITSGLVGCAHARSDPRLERRAYVLGLGVLLGWRLPLWGLILAIASWNLRTGRFFSEAYPVYLLALFAVSVVVMLDVYWSRIYVAEIRRLTPVEATVHIGS